MAGGCVWQGVCMAGEMETAADGMHPRHGTMVKCYMYFLLSATVVAER